MNKPQKYELKVIGAGLPRTGTFSQKVALEMLGFGKCYHMIENLQNNDSQFWIEIYDGDHRNWGSVFKNQYKSTTDAPACFFWEELLKENPDAKIIVSTRESPEEWWKSCSDTIFKAMTELPDFREKINSTLFPSMKLFKKFGERLRKKMGGTDKEGCIEFYKKYNEEVIEKCPKDKLLIYNVKQGWEPLCKFLGVPVPNKPFPKLNDTKTFNRRLFYMRNIGTIVLILVSLLVLLVSVLLQKFSKI
jgi:hypothetical protein